MKRRVLSILAIGILLLVACGEPTPSPPAETTTALEVPEKPATYTLNVSISPLGSGSVSPSTGQYKRGRKVTLTATPSSNYVFDHWSGDASGTSASITIAMDSDKNITAQFAATTPPPTETELRVHFIDVGQGDSILIDLEETEVLIDGGGKSPGVTTYLSNYVDGQLEVVVATHPHADHIGGLIAVLDSFVVQEIWHSGDTSTSQTYGQFMTAVQSEGAEVRIGKRGDQITVSELTFTILNPVTLDGTVNNNSIVLSLSYGEVDFLFTGDAEQEAEASMLSVGIVPDVEILKVGHHGSKTSSSQSFLSLAQPEVAVYMAGEGNRYGHPHEETITALSEFEVKIYGSDIHGTIVINTDGITYTLQLENQAPHVLLP